MKTYTFKYVREILSATELLNEATATINAESLIEAYNGASTRINEWNRSSLGFKYWITEYPIEKDE